MAGPTSRISNVCVMGPLAPFADAYRAKLGEQEYTPLTVVNQLRQLAGLSRWLETNRVRDGGSFGVTAPDLAPPTR